MGRVRLSPTPLETPAFAGVDKNEKEESAQFVHEIAVSDVPSDILI